MLNLLDKYRIENPRFNTVDDETVLKTIHQQSYSNIDYDTYKNKVLNTEATFGLSEQPDITKEPEVQKELQNSFVNISPKRIREIQGMKPMGSFEAMRKLVSWGVDDDKSEIVGIIKKSEKDVLNEDEKQKLKDYFDFQAQVQLRGVSRTGKILSGIGNSGSYIAQSSAVRYGLGAIGAGVGGAIAGPAGFVAGYRAVINPITEPIIQTALMPNQIEANKIDREYQSMITITDKGQVLLKRLNQIEEDAIKQKAISSTYIENLNESLWDMAFPIIGGFVGKAASKAKSQFLKKATETATKFLGSKFMKGIEGTTVSSIPTEMFEELATDVMNTIAGNQEGKWNDTFKKSPEEWFELFGIVAGAGTISRAAYYGASKLKSNGASPSDISAFLNMPETQKDTMVKQLYEAETEAEIQGYNQYLDNVKNKLVESGQTPEQAEASTKLFDLTTTYATSNYSDLSRVDFVKQNLGGVELGKTPTKTEQLLNDKILFQSEVLYKDDYGKNIVFDDNNALISIDDPQDTRFVALFDKKKDKKIGQINTEVYKKDWIALDIKIDNSYRGKGYGSKMIESLLNNISNQYKGIVIVGENRINDKEIPAIAKKLNMVEKDGDFYIEKPKEIANQNVLFQDKTVYNQKGQVKTESEAFKKWFGDSKTVDSKGKAKIFYHGTSKFGFSEFETPSYFTDKKQMAENYTSSAMSAISKTSEFYKTKDNAGVYQVYLKMEKPFDTRDEKTKKLFYNRYYQKYGNASDLTSKGLVDWSEANDLIDFIKENNLDYDSIILDGGFDNIHYLVLDPTQIKSVDNKGTFNPEDPNIYNQGIKGQFDTKTKIISLFENSDITTFQHETMHWFRGVVDNAVKSGSKKAQLDLDVMNKFVGAKTNNWTVNQQEKFARSYEQYLRKGIAPTEDLRTVFKKISDWFKEVYKTAKELKVSLTPEIAQFYDNIFKQGESNEITYTNKFNQVQQDIEDEKQILYQENPDLSEADVEAIIRQRFAKELMDLDRIKKEVELVNKKARLKAAEEALKPKTELKSVSEQIEDRLKELRVPKDKKAIRKSIETLLKYSKNVKKGTKSVGRFLYEDSKFFNTLRDYDKLTQDQAILELNNLKNNEDNSTVEFGIKERFLNYKAQGWYNTSIGLLSQIQQDLYNARELAKEAKDEADYINLLNKNEAKDEVLDIIKNKTADKDSFKTKVGNLYRVDIANVWSLINSITNKSIADKYNIEYLQNQTGTKLFNRVNDTTLKMQKVLGLKKYSQLVDTFNKWSLEKEKLVKSNGSKIDISTMEILDIYNAIKNDKSKVDYYEEYGQGNIENLVNRLSPEQKQIADIMMEDVQDYERLNKIHIELYNRDLPKVDNYWPATSEHESELDVFATYTNLSSSDISAMKERVKGKVKPIPRNAYSKYVKHVNQTEWIEGISPMRKQISDIFLNNTTKDYIKEKFGDRVVNRLNEEINDLSLTRQSQFMSSYEGLLGKMLSNWTVAKIGSPTVFIKQLSGVLNYAEEIDSLSWTKNFSKGLASPQETYKFMTENAPFLEARYKQGMNEALRGAIEVSKTSKLHSNITSIATFMTRLGDIGSIIYGGYGQVKTLIDSGMSKEEAFKKFEIATIRSQQSGLSSSLAPMQKAKSPLSKLFFAFQNTPFQYMRKIYDTVYLYKNGDITAKQAGKTLFMYGLLNPIIQTGLTAVLPYLLYDIWDDDKKERRKNSLLNEGLIAILTSPVAGVPFVNDISEFLIGLGISKVEDKKYQSYQLISTPMISDLEILAKRISDAKITTNDFMYSLLTGGEIATGIPLKNINKIQKTITDFDLLNMED